MKDADDALTNPNTESLQFVTTDGIARFDCGTLLNTNTDKLAVINNDVAIWRTSIKEWRETSGWLPGKTDGRYHRLRDGLKARAENSRRFEALALAEK
jgi:hypothetical protein